MVLPGVDNTVLPNNGNLPNQVKHGMWLHRRSCLWDSTRSYLDYLLC